MVSPLKNDKRISFSVRLNLNNPRHQEAWELLQSSPSSYAATIVDALVAFRENKAHTDLLCQIETTVRRVMGEVIRNVPVTVTASATKDALSEDNGEISDEDFDIADSFMSGL